MKSLLPKIIAGLIVLLAILSMYFGALRPMAKSRAYIAALKKGPSVASVQEFEENFQKSLNYSSFIGQEEVVKFLASDILGLISHENQTEEVCRELVRFIEPYLMLDNVRHLLTGAEMRNVLWRRWGREKDFNKAEEYYLAAYAIGPKLPPVLYGLLNLYQNRGDAEKLNKVAGEILGYWPNQN